MQVLPFAAGLNDGYTGSFHLLGFVYLSDMTVLYVEHPAGASHVEDVEQVKASKVLFKHLSKLALAPDESAEWIGKLAAER